MKIMKTSIMRKGILLLTFVMMLVLLAVASVFAAGDPDLTISVVYDPNQCTVYLTYDGLETGEEVMDPDGKSVNVPYGSKELKLVVEPVMGYALTSIEDMDNPGNSLKEPYFDCYYAASFLSSVRAKVECSPKVFDVKFEKADVTTLPYNPVSGDKGELYGLKYHYMQQDNLTVLPEVYRKGYTFQYWQVISSTGEEMVRITEKNEDGKYYLSHTLINTDMVLNGTIYLHAEFTPDPQKVTRYDYVWKQDTETGAWGQDKRLGTYLWEAPMDTHVSALTPMGEELANDGSINYKSYPGYTLYMDYPYKTSPITLVSENDDNPNEFTRYYTPIIYALDYQLDGGVLPEGACTTYVYDTRTPISQPTRRGYIFDGWIVMVDGEQVGEKTATDFVLGILDAAGNAQYAAEDGKIVLIAQWVPQTYTITYQWGDVPAELIPSLDAWNATLPQTFQFNQADFFIPNPFRAGYQFAGWTLTYTDGSEVGGENGLTAGEGKYYLDSTVHTTDITLTASWTVESYKVALDGQGATNEFTNEIPSVTYDAEWSLPDGFVIPLKDGFKFDGYWSALEGGVKYINADGTINVTKWDLDDADNAGVITFYARWIRESYSVTVTISGLPEGINPTIEILVGNTFYPNGVELPFETEYKVKITMPDGFKLVAWNGEAMDPTTMFESGTFTVGAAMQVWSAESRPQAPTYGSDGAVTSIDKNDTQIKVTMNPDVAHLYEFAILRNNNPENLTAEDWKQIVGDQNYYLFENLQPGTTYYVFVRLQENGEVPPGIIYVHSATVTNHETYVNNIKENLDNMLTDNDGDIANAVIGEIKDEIDSLVGSENFFEEVEKLIASVEAKLALARFQDSKIAELEAFLGDCFQSGSFNTANKERLSNICEVAVTKISSAGKTEDVEALFDTAMAEMKAIPVSYLHDATGTIQLSTLLGLGQNGGISLNSIEDIKALRRAVSDAIAQGKITADSFITIEEAKELISALDTVSAYNFYLTNVQPAEGDSFEFRMLIPEALAGRTGLQVAYYNAATGTVELLETTVEGNMLVFRAKQVADFVIMTDPTVDLTGVIIALGVIVLCQLIAIILVLAARSKAKNAIKHASVALPMFLTIYFQPANSEMIALGLGALALILQIVLMWLLISSGMIRVFKPKKLKPTRQKPAPAPRKQTLQNEPAAVPAEDTQAPMGSLVIEKEDLEEEYVETEQTLGEDAFDEGLADELAHEQAEDGSFAETEEVYDDEEFIEHAPNPYYSLDDEEDVYAYNQKETERVSDVDATGQETQETSYGADPIDGVFGEAYVQNGYSGDEGGDPYYAESDAGAYDYADEADAAQFESEILEGEETSDEGSIDPTAYIVNDNEEYSEEEEMYRYDE